MEPLGIILSSAVVGLFLAAALAAVDRRLAYGTATAAAGLFALAAAGTLATGTVHGLVWSGPLGDPEGLALDGLSAVFALGASLVWIATSIYSVGYDRGPSGLLAGCFALTLAAIALLVASTSFLLFVIGWEVMTLASYGMILQAHGRADRIYHAAFVFLAFGEGSTLLVIVAVAALRVGTGTFLFAALPAGSALALVAFLAGLVGFGLKMGVAPFHMSEWLPIAHSSAPSNASAVLSATLTLAGVYGLFRLLSLLPGPPVWWGGLVLGIGAVSALLGALFATVSEHAKGLPAYSTIENNGLILVALGVALVARADGLVYLAGFALFAALYQALVHAIAKTGLFLTAGIVERGAGSLDLNAVAGGGKGGEASGGTGGILAALSLAAAPPLAGFVSEWMILEALFQSYRFAPTAAQFVGLLAGAAVALAAGLIVVAMVKFVGFGFLWRPGSARRGSGDARLGLPVAGLGGLLLALGIGAPWLLRALAPGVSVFLGRPIAAPIGAVAGLGIPMGWTILSGSPLFGVLSPTVVPIAMALGASVAVGYWALGRRGASRRVEPWMAGSPPARPGETYTSFGFSTGIRLMMGSTLRTREVRARTGAVVEAQVATPVAYNVDLEVLDVFKVVYDTLVDVVAATALALQRGLMPGRLGRYIAYLLIVTLFVVVAVAAAS